MAPFPRSRFLHFCEGVIFLEKVRLEFMIGHKLFLFPGTATSISKTMRLERTVDPPTIRRIVRGQGKDQCPYTSIVLDEQDTLLKIREIFRITFLGAPLFALCDVVHLIRETVQIINLGNKRHAIQYWRNIVLIHPFLRRRRLGLTGPDNL